MTDGRGVVTSYSYGHIDEGSGTEYRNVLTKIAYTVPSGLYGVTDPSDITYGYDAAGNRISMTDGLGSMSYSYDSLSRLTSESRDFPGSGPDYSINYTYTLGGQLKSYTAPYPVELHWRWTQHSIRSGGFPPSRRARHPVLALMRTIHTIELGEH